MQESQPGNPQDKRALTGPFWGYCEWRNSGVSSYESSTSSARYMWSQESETAAPLMASLKIQASDLRFGVQDFKGLGRLLAQLSRSLFEGRAARVNGA